MARKAEWTNHGEDLPLPECPNEILIEWLFDAGPTMPTGMGAVPLTWRELRAWQDAMGLELQPGDLSVLRRLSAEYVAESAQASDPDRAPPWRETQPSDARRKAVAQSIRTSMRAAIAAQQEAPKTKRRRKS